MVVVYNVLCKASTRSMTSDGGTLFVAANNSAEMLTRGSDDTNAAFLYTVADKMLMCIRTSEDYHAMHKINLLLE